MCQACLEFFFRKVLKNSLEGTGKKESENIIRINRENIFFKSLVHHISSPEKGRRCLRLSKNIFHFVIFHLFAWCCVHVE